MFARPSPPRLTTSTWLLIHKPGHVDSVFSFSRFRFQTDGLFRLLPARRTKLDSWNPVATVDEGQQPVAAHRICVRESCGQSRRNPGLLKVFCPRFLSHIIITTP